MYALLPVSIVGLVFEAIFKGTLIVTFFSLGATKLGTMLGPLVLGTVAGGGGALVDGLEPAFKKGVPKPVWTSAAAATTHGSTHVVCCPVTFSVRPEMRLLIRCRCLAAKRVVALSAILSGKK